ncbi:MAG: stage V sporulation protein AC [Clostridiales bacterium]|jgi:stage V sporulation protein AC|nr:stage V sporulation protein AC [Clostridiales bacterium]
MESSESAKKQYQDLVEEISPNSRLWVDCLKAFVTGGLICCVGQWLNNLLIAARVSKDAAGTYTGVILIFCGVLLTGLGYYDKLGKYAGAGTVVPITGFANSVAAPAIEFKKEGFVLGMAAKMFLVAGPVIVYGALASVLVGLFYYFSR